MGVGAGASFIFSGDLLVFMGSRCVVVRVVGVLMFALMYDPWRATLSVGCLG